MSELRAAISLCRLAGKSGEAPEAEGEARELLSRIYQRFEEGFELPELRRARALLAAESA